MNDSLKILNVITGLSTGGAEKLLVDSIDSYLKKKIQVDILTLDGTETPFLKKAQSNPSSKVFSITKGSVYNPLIILKILPYFKKYDIIHVHLFPALYWVALAKILSFSKVKLVYTEHSTSNRRRKSRFFKYADKFIYRTYSKIITIAEEVDYNIKKHLNLPLQKFQMIKNGIDTRFFFNSLPYNKDSFFSNSDKILIQVASFREQKDHETLIKAMVKLPDDVKLLLVGEGYLKDKCINLARDLNIEGRIKFLGVRMDVPRLLKTADIVVLSSVHEGLSLSSIEGMAVGKPFVASNVPGLREMVQDVGTLFEKGNATDLADKIAELLQNESYYREIADRCYQHSKKFDLEVMINSYIRLYQTI